MAIKKSYKGGIMTAMSTWLQASKAPDMVPLYKHGHCTQVCMFPALMPWVSGSDFKTRISKFSRTVHVFALAIDKGSGETYLKTSITYKMGSCQMGVQAKGSAVNPTGEKWEVEGLYVADTCFPDGIGCESNDHSPSHCLLHCSVCC
ncbi:putative long-chain-alcohol oxidase [Helianthus annuus]|uniref:Long-chain-alcohol oxidase n=1 Tax=Helianthus annuus TaxID=4232 RepID=A0A251UEK0_HELAN|nr:putative long-chain-alcohol oxidase [Helianthus annuus]